MTSAADVTAAIIGSVELTGAAAPRVVVYTPHARGNPFQDMLYSALWGRGIAAVPCADFRALPATQAAVATGGSAAVHVHWTSNITEDCATVEEFRVRSQEFLENVHELRSIGVRLIWTIHNPIEHDSPYPSAEIEFRAALAQSADVIHLMSEHALGEITHLYPVDERKVAVVPHPAYVGVYPEYAAQADCRSRLGLSGRDLVVGLVGALRPYKRVEELHRACQEVSSPTRRVRLLVAGEVIGANTVMAEAIGTLRRDPWATLLPRKLTDREMSEAVLACDVIACAYDSPLTSGASLLAMSLRRPVILPDRPISRDLAGDGGLYYDIEDPHALAGCIGDLDRDDLAHRGHLARKRAEAFRFDLVAERFADVVSGWV